MMRKSSGSGESSLSKDEIDMVLYQLFDDLDVTPQDGVISLQVPPLNPEL